MHPQRTVLTKPCEQCGTVFEKPVTCSAKVWPRRRFCSLRCKAESQVGIPVGPFERKAAPRPRRIVPCRICGRPTKYSGPTLIGRVHCGNESCREASRLLKNERIRATHTEQFRNGRKAAATWKDVSLVSPEERLLEPWFRSIGWECQVHTLTHVSSVKLPRYATLDFALPERKLFVEIDGTSHRTRDRQERDARRDALLAAQGWRGVRIAAKEVRTNPEGVKDQVLSLCAS